MGWAVALDFLGLVVADGSALSCMHAGGLASWCGHPFAIVSIGDSLGAMISDLRSSCNNWKKLATQLDCN